MLKCIKLLKPNVPPPPFFDLLPAFCVPPFDFWIVPGVGRAPSALISVTMSLSLLHLDLRRSPRRPGSVAAVLRRSFSLSIYCSGPAHTLSTPFVFLLATLRPFAPIDGHRGITATTTATRTCSHMAWCTPPCRWLLEARCRQRNFWCPTWLEGGLGQILHWCRGGRGDELNV